MYIADEKRYETMKYNRCGKKWSKIARGVSWIMA